MKVLVSVASKHGTTAEIAEELGKALDEALRERGVGDEEIMDVRMAEQVSSMETYDAVVLGSAVYMGHWLEPARELAERHTDALAKRPIWLFSSGPIGDPPRPEEEPVDVALILEATRAREHRLFSGKIDRQELGFGEKAVMMAFRAPAGDFRYWEAIRDWGRNLTTELTVA